MTLLAKAGCLGLAHTRSRRRASAPRLYAVSEEPLAVQRLADACAKRSRRQAVKPHLATNVDDLGVANLIIVAGLFQ